MFQTGKLSNLLCLLFFMAILASQPTTAAAESSDSKHSTGLMVGQVWPSGELGKDVDGNVAPGIFYEYAASDIFSLYSNAIHSSHSNEKLKMLSTDLGIKANLVYYDKLSPYALLGMGLYFVNKKVGATQEEAEATLFGFNLGLGADLDLSEYFYMGMIFSIHNMFSKTISLPLNGNTELSGRWTGFFLRGGVRF